MFLSKLALRHFKNHSERNFEFKSKLSCLIGNNGAGKTNILDSIYYLCLTKSYFGHTDQQNITFGQNFFRLDADIRKDGQTYQITFKYGSNRRKELLVNDVPKTTYGLHIGEFPVVMITPQDSEMIYGGSEERRKFLDATIAQVNRKYLENLMHYNQFLAQRNALLKSFAEKNTLDKPLLETYDQQLHALGTEIFEARKTVLERLQQIFEYFYSVLSLEREQVSFRYSSQLTENTLDELLERNLQRDLVLQRTESGIHKDDIEFYIGTNKIKRFGSQGQQKSFLLALKMAQYQFIRGAKGFMPFLLIDDIFDKLDADRSAALLNIICGDDFGQVFITDTESGLIEDALQQQKHLYEIFKIESAGG